jgi:hypothetical protein
LGIMCQLQLIAAILGIDTLQLTFDEACLRNQYAPIVLKIAPVERAVGHKLLYLRSIRAESFSRISNREIGNTFMNLSCHSTSSFIRIDVPNRTQEATDECQK